MTFSRLLEMLIATICFWLPGWTTAAGAYRDPSVCRSFLSKTAEEVKELERLEVVQTMQISAEELLP